mmetsp:Transcript_28010/g.60308  ORF Transcript_28010/g.60308 Transcript_28010/m.60308 type:complete len:165 (-) Transcript_28010:715-1209(-)|eukprot:CAMPEP_0183341804 /NCGR_PEP_ID=MMETSP0164_2-20130417/8023_1 /TAXON_ID=221442 /ORGANISM="Coccolithus pelagicus ssp braarudi, Strain PLY182g" /LENGTH=164 /DNA_ID=CAMNT_0025512227 /DNA_START=60 /DNA_END=554 /DNA_ORIENTATION=-
MLDSIIDFLWRNPIMVLLILFMLYRKYQGSQPWPDYGGKVTSVHNLEEWKALKEESVSANKLLVIDCYATWCPPCKAAAPHFAKMSEAFTGCIFAKINVDEAKDVSSELSISAMPTFKVFRGEAELGVCKGWSEETLRGLLASHGASAQPADAGDELDDAPHAD